MGIQVCANQGAGPYWDPVRGQNRENFGYLKNSSQEPLAQMH